MNYPRTLHASVLLDDKKRIIGWKIGTRGWDSVIEALDSKHYDRKLRHMATSTEKITKVCESDEENSRFFNITSTDFFKTFDINPEMRGVWPYSPEQEPNELKEKSVHDIIMEAAKRYGADCLCGNNCGCGCEIDELGICGHEIQDCVLGKKRMCKPEDCDDCTTECDGYSEGRWLAFPIKIEEVK